MIRLNLTQHEATSAQSCAPRNEATASIISELLTFATLDEAQNDRRRRAEELRDVAVGMARDAGHTLEADPDGGWTLVEVMIGGAPWFMRTLEDVLTETPFLRPVYAFSPRVVTERTDADGKIVKTSEFRHQGFIMA